MVVLEKGWSGTACLTYKPDVPLEGTQRGAGFAGAEAEGQLFPPPLPSRRWTARRDVVGDTAGDGRRVGVERRLADLQLDGPAVRIDEQAAGAGHSGTKEIGRAHV